MKRDECLAGKLSFEEFGEWLERGHVRKNSNINKIAAVDGEK